MPRYFYENTILKQYDAYCAKAAHNWLRARNFTRTDDIWEDAYQCARLGFLLYIRDHCITKAEDVFKDGTSPYWYIHRELQRGIIFGARAPCGIRRPGNKLRLNFTPIPYDAIENDSQRSIRCEDGCLSQIETTAFINTLNEEERQIVTMKLEGMKPREIMQRLGMPRWMYSYKIKQIRRQWTRRQ